MMQSPASAAPPKVELRPRRRAHLFSRRE